MQRHALSVTRQENYPEWYQAVIQAADLAENSPVRGCMVIKPWGYAIWENMQRILDGAIKETGHENAYFPLLIPLSFLEKEAQHIAGFAKECAVVTHHRLEATPDGKLHPAGELEEPFIIRPTSETIIGTQFAKWIQSYRDLPLLINQWANVMRWEMRTRLFLRTSEFLWQEGHTAHATAEEAMAETLKMLDVYADFVENSLAIPVIKGEKTAEERFPGAINTYTIEAMMQDKKALQAGTSHFMGQTFSRSFEIAFTDAQGQQQYTWTTSWGCSTRLIGGLIMTHSDDDGLIVPPKVAPAHIIILPIFRNVEEEKIVMEYCEALRLSLVKIQYDNVPLRVRIDKRELNGGEKNWQAIKKGVPVRLEIGPRDIEKDSVFMGRRDKPVKEKMSVSRDTLLAQITTWLAEMQTGLLAKARAFQQANIYPIHSLTELKKFFGSEDSETAHSPGFALCYAATDELEQYLKPLKATPRCIPLDQDPTPGTCIFTGQATSRQIIIAKSY